MVVQHHRCHPVLSARMARNPVIWTMGLSNSLMGARRPVVPESSTPSSKVLVATLTMTLMAPNALVNCVKKVVCNFAAVQCHPIPIVPRSVPMASLYLIQDVSFLSSPRATTKKIQASSVPKQLVRIWNLEEPSFRVANARPFEEQPACIVDVPALTCKKKRNAISLRKRACAVVAVLVLRFQIPFVLSPPAPPRLLVLKLNFKTV